VINAGTAPVPLEVKATAFARPNVERSLRSFIEKYSPEQAFVVNLSLQETIRVGTTDVQFIPWWRLYEIDFILPLSGRNAK